MAQILKPDRKDNRGGHPNSGRKKKKRKKVVSDQVQI